MKHSQPSAPPRRPGGRRTGAVEPHVPRPRRHVRAAACAACRSSPRSTLLVVVAPLAAFGVLPGVDRPARGRRAGPRPGLAARGPRRWSGHAAVRRTRAARREPAHTTHGTAGRPPSLATTRHRTAAREPQTVAAPARGHRGRDAGVGQTPDAEAPPGSCRSTPSPAPAGSRSRPAADLHAQGQGERPVPVAAPVAESASAVEEPELRRMMDDLLHRRRAAGA